MEQNHLKSRAFIVTVIILLLIAVVLFSMYIFRTRDLQAAVGVKRSLDAIESEAKFGPLTYVSTREESGASNYTDERYSYWFNSENLLISRVLIDSPESDEKNLTVSEAFLIAVSTMELYLEDTDFRESGWETTITATDSPSTPWLFTFTFTDQEGVITKRNKVEINAYGESGFVSISEEERSIEKIRISEAEAVDLAVIEVSALLEEQGYIEKTPENVRQNAVFDSGNNVLFAYQKKSIWSIRIEGIDLDDKKGAAYEVQINAVTGETIQVEECR